ncbi:MAG TPA: SRPBCC family protein [Candidatus Sulfopaludibacter sp.]|nr:SRPBCC family protein [Candidatus Sulfopaludibacter sp.]
MAKQSTLLIPGDAALLYEVLTDYARLPEWLPQVTAAKLLAREGDLVLAELELAGGEATRVSMECIHSKDKEVSWLPVEEEIPITGIQWGLEPAAGGQCSVSLRVERPVSVARFSSAWRSLMEPAECLEALKNHVEIFLPDGILAQSGCERVLEIVETDQGMICWLRGRKYKMVPVTDSAND